MENIKQIKINEELHDIEDTQARNDIASEVTNRTNADNELQEKINTNKNDIIELKGDLANFETNSNYVAKYDLYNVSITSGGDVQASEKTFPTGKRFVALSTHKKTMYIYPRDGASSANRRKYFSNGYLAFDGWGNYGATASGNGSFTSRIMYFDVTDNLELENALKTIDYNGETIGGVFYKKLVVHTENLDEQLASNFIVLKDKYHYFNKSAFNSVNLSSFTLNENDISFTSSSKEPFYICNDVFFKAGHKYAIVYNVEANYKYRFKIMGHSEGWRDIFVNTIQTGGVQSSGVVIKTSNYDQRIGFDMVFENDITTLSGNIKIYDITNIDDDVAETLDYTNLGTDVTTLNFKYVNNGNDNDKHLLNKKIVFYGDSITAQNLYTTKVKDYYGFTMINAGVGGSTIYYRSDTDMSSDTRISALPSDADIVFIMGGTNDWGKIQIEDTLTYNNGFDRTKFKGGLAYIIKGIEAQCPNAKIIVATLIGGRNETRLGNSPVTQYLPEADRYGQTDLDFRNAEIEVANIMNIDVCDTWSCGINGINSDTMIADTVHPTDKGATLIADYIIGYLKTVII